MKISCVDRLLVIQSEIEILKARLQPHDTGHIHTAISVLNERLSEVADNIKQRTDPETMSGTLRNIADGV